MIPVHFDEMYTVRYDNLPQLFYTIEKVASFG